MNDYDTLEVVLRVAERIYRVSRDKLTGCCRGQAERGSYHDSWARQMAIYGVRECTNLSSTRIGHIFNRDHATVLWAYRRVRAAAMNGKAKEVSRFVDACREEGVKFAMMTPIELTTALRALAGMDG